MYFKSTLTFLEKKSNLKTATCGLEMSHTEDNLATRLEMISDLQSNNTHLYEASPLTLSTYNSLPLSPSLSLSRLLTMSTTAGNPPLQQYHRNVPVEAFD